MRIPDSTIEQVRQSADIVDVISHYVQLKKKGKQHWGVCPFHSEKTPSFSVNADKQIFYCFGCHTGGNVFRFLMEYKKLTFVESIIELANEYGIHIDYEKTEDPQQQSEKEQMFDLNEEVGRLFLDILLKSPNAQHARDYFEKRNIKVQSIRSFGLGFAPPDRSYLVDHFSKSPEKTELAVKLGLVIRTDTGRLYDRFAGRIIFPIFSPNGRVIAFAGRIMESGTDAAKYVNSPESPIYTKGKVLYGLSIAKDEIRRADQAIMVEGYMDLLALFQSGIKNVIAVSGTALTEDQTLLLSRYTKNVVAMFDADEAGIKASMRSVEILLKKNMNISIASLGNNDDPDSFINKFGKQAMLDQINKAVDFLEFQTAFYVSKGMLDAPQKSVETIRELLRPVALIDDELKRILLIKSLAQKFFLREKLLEDELQIIIDRNKAAEHAPARVGKTTTQQSPTKEGDLAAFATKFATPEKELLRLLLEGEPEIIRQIKDEIAPDDLVNATAKGLLSLIYAAVDNNESVSISYLIDRIEDEELRQEITMIGIDSYIVSEKWEETNPSPDKYSRLRWATTDTIRKLKLLKVEQELASLRQQLEQTKDDEAIITIMTKIRGELNNKNEIEKKYASPRPGY